MPQLVTDPDILRQLNAPDPVSAGPPTAAAASPRPATGVMQRVTDPDLLRQLNEPDAPPPGVRFAPQGAPGPQGLVWGKDGGRDPQSGELVVAGKPFSQNAPSQGLAAMSSGLSGVPILGPYLERGAEAAGAYARQALYGDPADQTESAVKGDVARSQAAYPKTSTASSIAGGVIGMAPAIAAAPEMFGAGGGSLAGRVLTGGAAGMDVGGLDAAARHGDDMQAVTSGAAGGAIAGAAGPVLGSIAAKAGEGAANLVSRYAVNRTGLPRPVAQSLLRTAETDGALGPEGLARIRDAGPSGMLADIGPSTAGALDMALQRGGPGSTAARQAIEARAAGANADLTGAMDTAFGAPRGIHTVETGIRQGSADARQAAYDRAYDQPIDFASPPGRAIEMLMRNHVPAKAIAQANALIRADPAAGPSRQILAHLGDDGAVTYERLPDVRQVDFVTRGLRDVAEAENGKGKLGGTTQLGATYGNLAKAIRARLRQAVPAYAEALDTAAEPIAARNALQFGSDLLRSSVTRDVVADELRGMSRAELDQVRQGVRSHISEVLSNVTRTMTDPNIDARQAMTAVKALSSDAAQEKIGLLISPPEASALWQKLGSATKALELRAAVATNSKTYARAATDEAVHDATARPTLDAILGLRPLRAGENVLRSLAGRRPADITRAKDESYGQIADTLTGHRGPAAESILERLIGANDASTRAGSIAGSVPYGAISQTGLLSLLPRFDERASLIPRTP